MSLRLGTKVSSKAVGAVGRRKAMGYGKQEGIVS
jgi:hypothetical protein